MNLIKCDAKVISNSLHEILLHLNNVPHVSVNLTLNITVLQFPREFFFSAVGYKNEKITTSEQLST